MQIWNAILSFINNNAPLWSFLVTIATIVYVVLTNKMLKESETARKLQNRPYVIADLAIESIWLKMTVKNVGNDSASNVKISVDEIAQNPLSSIDFLAPGRELVNVIKYAYRGKEDKEESPLYHFHISYTDTNNETFKRDYIIDVSPLLNSTDYDQTKNKEIVDKLDKIVDRIKDTNTEIRRLSDSLKSESDAVKDIKNKLR